MEITVINDGNHNSVDKFSRVSDLNSIRYLLERVVVLANGVELVLIIYFDVHLII